MPIYTYEPIPCPSRNVVQRLRMLAQADRDAGRPSVGPFNERIAVALILDRADWLTNMGCSMLDATQHLDAVWLQACSDAQRSLRRS